MPNYLTQTEAFEKCTADGKFGPIREINIDKIKSAVRIAEADFETGRNTKKGLDRKSDQWSSVYKLHYDALHELVEAFLRFEKIKSDNHQCLFAYLCEKHPELEFDWDFFEKIRTKRNGINYYGIPAVYEDWKDAELQITLYFTALKKAIEKKIGEFKE